MQALRVLAFFCGGWIYGSFLAVVVYRVPRHLSIATLRCACPTCGTQIRARDNLRVVSWSLTRGRCHTCGARLPVRYPFAELATGALCSGASLTLPDLYVATEVAAFLGLMLALALIDVEHRILPNAIIYPALIAFGIAAAVGGLIGDSSHWWSAVIGSFAFGGGLLVVAIVSPGGMGMGDVKFAALIGLVLGSLGLQYVAVAAGLGILAGGVGAVVALILKRSRKTAIPFGPYLAIGAAASVFWAPAIARAYLS